MLFTLTYVNMVLESQYKTFLQERKLDHHGYQWEGLQWCLSQEAETKYRGGIVADEMGLGKTLLMISLIAFNLTRRTLIIVPPILLNQWEAQLKYHTGHQPLIYHGSNKNKHKITLEQLQQAPLVLASYHAIAVHESNPKLSILHQVKWNRVIYDECHHLRNATTSLFLGAFIVKSKVKWFLSGTPIQNRLKDITNILLLLGYTNKMEPDTLKELIKQKMLKRTKRSVGLVMPEMKEETIMIPWSDDKDTQVSEDIHSAVSFSGVSSDKQKDFGRSLAQTQVIVAMMRAKQVCVYPKLIYEYLEEHRGDTTCSQYSGDTKLSWLVDKLMERRGNGNGKLVFCQFRKEIDYLKEKLVGLGMSVGVIDGRTKDKIDTPFEVLILQIQSCCEGLNLQDNYSEMYFSSNQWNPCIEEQAIGRCYRLGQKKEVSVFRYQMSRLPKEQDAEEAPITMENYIAMVQDRKRALADEFVASNVVV